MRALYPHGLVLGTRALVDYYPAFSNGTVGLHVVFDDAYGPVSVILRLSVGSVVIVDYISPSVIVEEYGRVDSLHLGKHYRVGPLSERVGSLDEEIAGAHIGREHIVGAVVGIVLYRGSEDSAADMLAVEVHKLRGPVEHVAHLLPVEQVAAVE